MVYIMPKYNLQLATSQPDRMAAMMSLATATCEADVRTACSGEDGYDFLRHKFLRQTFVSVYVTADGQAFDGHADFAQGCFTEHQLFVKGILDSGPGGDRPFLAKIPQGPKSNRRLGRRPKARPKRSAALKRMLGDSGRPSEGAGSEPAGSEHKRAQDLAI